MVEGIEVGIRRQICRGIQNIMVHSAHLLCNLGYKNLKVDLLGECIILVSYS